MKIGNININNPIALSSMSGITNAKYALDHASKAGLIILGSYNIDQISKEASLESMNYGRTEFIIQNPIEDILLEINLFKELFVQNKINSNQVMPQIGVSVRSRSIEDLTKIAYILSKRNIILEIDCHCRQEPYLKRGLGENLCKNMNYLKEIIDSVKKTGVILSIKIRAISIENIDHFINIINNTNLDIIHVDAMDIDNKCIGNKNIIKVIKNKIKGKIIIANNCINSFEDAMNYFANGADIVSIARGSKDNKLIEKIVNQFNEYNKDIGWYNAPNHICKNGDLRGLSFCCPPIKNCSLIQTLSKNNITTEEYINIKKKYASETPLILNTNTCFGSLMWCCKSTKNCIYRDMALDSIGLKKSEYMKYKKILGDNILSYIHNKK